MSKVTNDRHWQTQDLVAVLIAIPVNEVVKYDELSRLSGVPALDIRARRLQRAKKIAERDHHVLIDTLTGVGVRRLPQEEVGVPIAKRRTRIRGAARRIVASIRDGITDFDKLPGDVKTTAYASRAVAGAVLLATSSRSAELLKGQVETANGELNIGRTLELLKK
jgi:hypothetical protein